MGLRFIHTVIFQNISKTHTLNAFFFCGILCVTPCTAVTCKLFLQKIKAFGKKAHEKYSILQF